MIQFTEHVEELVKILSHLQQQIFCCKFTYVSKRSAHIALILFFIIIIGYYIYSNFVSESE